MLVFCAIFGVALFSTVESGPIDSKDGRFDFVPSWTPKCPPGAGKIPRLIPNPQNCRGLFICHGGRLQEYFCPPGKVFDPERQECSKQRSCETGSMKDDWSAFGTCPEDGRQHYFRNPVDCAMFYQCSHGFAYPHRCPSRLHFNTKKNVCDWPENVDCESSFFMHIES